MSRRGGRRRMDATRSREADTSLGSASSRAGQRETIIMASAARSVPNLDASSARRSAAWSASCWGGRARSSRRPGVLSLLSMSSRPCGVTASEAAARSTADRNDSGGTSSREGCFAISGAASSGDRPATAATAAILPKMSSGSSCSRLGFLEYMARAESRSRGTLAMRPSMPWVSCMAGRLRAAGCRMSTR